MNELDFERETKNILEIQEAMANDSTQIGLEAERKLREQNARMTNIGMLHTTSGRSAFTWMCCIPSESLRNILLREKRLNT
jgi:hypothetical protein